MNQSKIPVRYARALFLLGKEKNILDKLAEEVKLLADFFDNTPALIPWLRSPVIKMQQKKDLFRKQFKGRLSELTLNFTDLVINKKRERHFPEIFRNFIHFYKTDAGISTLVLTTASEVDESIKNKVSLGFDSKNQKRHEIITRVKPSIIGGFMLQIDDLLYDASLATELKRLKKELTGQLMEETYKKKNN